MLSNPFGLPKVLVGCGGPPRRRLRPSPGGAGSATNHSARSPTPCSQHVHTRPLNWGVRFAKTCFAGVRRLRCSRAVRRGHDAGADRICSARGAHAVVGKPAPNPLRTFKVHLCTEYTHPGTPCPAQISINDTSLAYLFVMGLPTTEYRIRIPFFRGDLEGCSSGERHA